MKKLFRAVAALLGGKPQKTAPKISAKQPDKPAPKPGQYGPDPFYW